MLACSPLGNSDQPALPHRLVGEFDGRSNKRITKALISLGGCAGWSAPLLFANPEDRFSCVEVYMILEYFDSQIKDNTMFKFEISIVILLCCDDCPAASSFTNNIPFLALSLEKTHPFVARKKRICIPGCTLVSPVISFGIRYL